MRLRLPSACVAFAVLGFTLGRRPPFRFERSPADSRVSPGGASATNSSTQAPGAVQTMEGFSRKSPDRESPRVAQTLGEMWKRAQTGSENAADFRLRVMSELNRLSADELVGILQGELREGSFLRTERFDFRYAAERLCEVAPEKAAALWAAEDAVRSGLSDALIQPWAARDPVAMANWILTQPAEIQRAGRGALRSVAESDPEKFLTFAHQVGSLPGAGEMASAAMKSFLGRGSAAEDTGKALDYAAKLPAGSLRDAALAELAKSAKVEIPAHPEILRALGALSEGDAYRLGAQLVQKLETLPGGPVRDAALRASFANEAAADAAAAAKKLELLSPNSPDYPGAVRGFVERLAANDPAAAAAWAVSIPASASKHRTAALERVAAAYFKSNPGEARAWVERAPLSEEEYERLMGRKR